MTCVIPVGNARTDWLNITLVDFLYRLWVPDFPFVIQVYIRYIVLLYIYLNTQNVLMKISSVAICQSGYIAPKLVPWPLLCGRYTYLGLGGPTAANDFILNSAPERKLGRCRHDFQDTVPRDCAVNIRTVKYFSFHIGKRLLRLI